MLIDTEKIAKKEVIIAGSKTKCEPFFFLQIIYSQGQKERLQQQWQQQGMDYYFQTIEIPYFYGTF